MSPAALAVTRWYASLLLFSASATGTKHSDCTGATCKRGGPSGRPVALSHRRTLLSVQTVASSRPSGLYCIHRPAQGCTIGSPTAFPAAASHCSMVPVFDRKANTASRERAAVLVPQKLV